MLVLYLCDRYEQSTYMTEHGCAAVQRAAQKKARKTITRWKRDRAKGDQDLPDRVRSPCLDCPGVLVWSHRQGHEPKGIDTSRYKPPKRSSKRRLRIGSREEMAGRPDRRGEA